MTAYVRPATLDAALAARRDHPDFTVLAGGTDLLVGAARRPDPPGVIDLFGLGALVGIAEDADGALVIGAATTYLEILDSELARRRAPALCASAREVGALQIQARGTLAGNLVTSSPVGDTLPVLLALDAVVEVASVGGRRRVPYEAWCTGYRQTALAADELVVAVRFPALPDRARQFWRKVGTRRAQSISKVMVAACGRARGGVIDHARIALGAVADRPIRARRTEEVLLGLAPGEDAATRARAAVADEITPIDDVRSNASYRREVAENVVARFVLSLAGTDDEAR